VSVAATELGIVMARREPLCLSVTDVRDGVGVVDFDAVDIVDRCPAGPVSRPLEGVGDDRDAASCPDGACRLGERAAGGWSSVDTYREQMAVGCRDFASDDDSEITIGCEFRDADGSLDRIVIRDDDAFDSDGSCLFEQLFGAVTPS